MRNQHYFNVALSSRSCYYHTLAWYRLGLCWLQSSGGGFTVEYSVGYNNKEKLKEFIVSFCSPPSMSYLWNGWQERQANRQKDGWIDGWVGGWIIEGKRYRWTDRLLYLMLVNACLCQQWTYQAVDCILSVSACCWKCCGCIWRSVSWPDRSSPQELPQAVQLACWRWRLGPSCYH